jgi:hypothetical protein
MYRTYIWICISLYVRLPKNLNQFAIASRHIKKRRRILESLTLSVTAQTKKKSDILILTIIRYRYKIHFKN